MIANFFCITAKIEGEQNHSRKRTTLPIDYFSSLGDLVFDGKK